MKFPFACVDCGHINHFEWSQVGQRIACGRCRTSLTVPAPMETMPEPAESPRVLKFRCPSCRRKFAIKPSLAGQKIRCSGCGAGVRVPEAEQVPDSSSSHHVQGAFAEIDEITTTPTTSRVAPRRPEAPPRSDPGARPSGVARPDVRRAEIARKDVVPPDLPRVDVARVDAKTANVEAEVVSPLELESIAGLEGTKRRRRPESVLSSRSEMLELARQQAAAEESSSTQEAAATTLHKPKTKGKGKRKAKKKHSSFFDPKETLKLVAGVGALVAVMAFLAWGYEELRFPLGGFLCVIGFIVYALGAVSLRQLVAEEGILKMLLYRFFPPYQWWFVFTRWQDAKDFFAFFLAGAMVMSLGGAIIKTSPAGKKAEASERALQKMLKDQRSKSPPPAPLNIADDRDD